VAALRALTADGVPLTSMVDALNGGRLAQLVLERALVQPGKCTLAQVAEEAAVDVGEITAWFRAIGRGMPVADTPTYTDDDVLAAQRLRE
jgi:hypothetical protein